MKTFDVNGSEVQEGISVVEQPYPHIVLGEGGNKRATWIVLGKRDAENIVADGRIVDVGVIALKDAEGKPSGKYLIVAPRGADDRVLVLWRVSSGYRGSASITPGEGVTVLASDHSWHSGRGNMGETAELLAILKPGQELTARRSGRRVEQTRAKLVYDGNQVLVTFGDENLDSALAEEAEGEYV